MADENRELLEAMEELRRAMGATTVDFEELEEQIKKSQVGMKAFKKVLAKTPGEVAAGLGSFAKGVAAGDTSIKSFNTIIDTATGALAGLASTIPVLGSAISGTVKAVGEASKFVVNQLEATAKTFNDFGQAGALTSKGMSGLFEQFNRSGMSLDGFRKAVTENSAALARFRGTVGEGAENFSQIVGDIVDSNAGTELRRLGLSADQIGDTAAAFVTQQTRLGRAQAMTNQQLTEGTVRYAKELDELSKLTGMNREAIQKQQDAALSESRFRASLHGLNQQQQKDLLNLQTMMQGFGAELGQGTRDLVSGAANTDAARKLMADTGGAAADIIERLKAGQISQSQAQVEMQDAVKRNLEAQAGYQKFVSDGESVFTNFANKADLASAELVNGQLISKKTQKDQIAGQDELTNTTVDAQRNLEKMSRQFQRLGFELMPSAAKAIESFTSVVTQAVEKMSEKLGIPMPGGRAPTGAAAARADAVAASQGTTADMLNAGAEAQLTPAERAAGGSAADLAGLRIKSPEAYSGGEANPRLIEVARMIQEKLGGDLKHFSAFNDSYHRGPNSLHSRGMALDFTLNDPSRAAEVAAMIKAIPGVSKVIDEYANPSSQATAGHIHAEISARNGFSGILSGPSSGYRPNLLMHGTEELSIKPATGSGATGASTDSNIMSAQLARLDELVSVMKTQTSLTSKILQLQA